VFDVIPAIDVSGGRLVVFGPDGPEPSAAFDADPVAAARAARDAGARVVHVVDVDLALRGRFENAPVLRRISDLGVAVQAAGGIRSSAEVDDLLDAGAARVVLGSGALRREDAVRDLLDAHGDRLVIGIELDGDRIRSRGRDPVDLGLMETLGWVVAAGARTLLLTAVGRVGGLGGPDVASTRRVARAGRPVLVAGGVRSIEDLHALRAAGAAGAIVGRAAQEGALDLAEAIAATR
jgi:phosphoribosylformimino-5-aminoimidazole carboxamide ribonucleotide (ProFAR) isomerase